MRKQQRIAKKIARILGAVQHGLGTARKRSAFYWKSIHWISGLLSLGGYAKVRQYIKLVSQ